MLPKKQMCINIPMLKFGQEEKLRTLIPQNVLITRSVDGLMMHFNRNTFTFHQEALSKTTASCHI